MTALRAAILDVDGTLVDSNAAHASTWALACDEFGFARSNGFFRPLIGMGSDRVLPKVDPRLNDEADPGTAILARRGELFRARFLPDLRATPGAKALVDRLRERGLMRVVATSGAESDLDDLLRVAGVEGDIDVRTTSDDASASKPAGDIVTAALRKAGVEPGQAVMIGDTPHDVEAGARAGVRVIALRCGGWDDHDLRDAVAIYDDPADLVRNFEASIFG